MTVASVARPGPHAPLNSHEKRSSIKDLSSLFIRGIVHAVEHEEEEPAVTEGAMSTVDINLDSSDILTGAITTLYPSVASSSVVASTSAIADASLFQGALTVKEAHDKYHLFDSARAFSRKPDAALDMLRGCVQGTMGLANMGYRPLLVTSLAANADIASNSSSLLGRVTFALGTACGALSSLFFSCTAVLFTRSLVRLKKFEAKLCKEGDLTDLSNPKNITNLCRFIIENRAQSTPLSTLNKQVHIHGEKKALEEFGQVALDATKKWIKTLCREGQKKGISTEHLQKAELTAKDLFAHLSQMPSIKEHLMKDLHIEGHPLADKLNIQELIGLEILSRARELKKEIKLSEFLGKNAAARVIEGARTSLVDRLSSTDPFVSRAAMKEGEELIEAVKEGIKAKKTISIGQTISAIVGIFGVIAAAIPAAGALGIALSLTSLASFIGLFLMDLYNFKFAHDEKGPVGAYDKLLIKMSIVIGVASLTAASICASIFSCGTIPAAIGIATCFVWLVNNIYGYYKIHKKEKAYRMSHPKLEDVRRALSKESQNKPLSEALSLMMKNLGSEDKKQIKKMVLGTSQQDIRILDPEDLKLDLDHRFGEKYFMLHPKDSAVERAVEKAWQASHSMELRALLERIRHSDEKEVKRYFYTFLSKTERALVTEGIYHKKARKLSSRSFDAASCSKIKMAVDTLIQKHQKEKIELHDTHLTVQISALTQLLYPAF